jgi:DNA-3-methyladenine glycosylase II
MFQTTQSAADIEKAIATALAEGRLDLDALTALEDEAAIEALVAVHGIGRWTAEIYLLFALGRPDVWPAGDLALAEAARRLLDLPARPDPKAFRVLGARWSPWRGAVAHLLWHYYGTVVV